MVTCSHAHAQRQKKSFQNRLDKAEDKLSKLKPRAKDTVDPFRSKAEKILRAYSAGDYPGLEVNESITTRKKYTGRGPPLPENPL